MKIIKVETRIFKLKDIFEVEINPQKISIHELKFAVRNTAKNNPIYFTPVKLSIPVETEVKVNNFGRWLFGVKGFKGHWQTFPVAEDKAIIRLPEIQEAIDLIEEVLKCLKKQGIIKCYLKKTKLGNNYES